MSRSRIHPPETGASAAAETPVSNEAAAPSAPSTEHERTPPSAGTSAPSSRRSSRPHAITGSGVFAFSDDAPLFGDTASNQNVEIADVEEAWKVLVVDDDEQVHAVTRMVLADFELDGRSLEFLHAHSGAEAQSLVDAHDDIAIVLLDVVMESNEAGLETVRYIRDVVKNKNVRIILRTGQPGSAPEQRVIREYDINDYREKTELTSHKLQTSIFSALRSYRDIVELDRHKRGLESVIEASSAIFRERSVDRFAEGVLGQLQQLLGAHGAVEAADGLAAVAWGNDDLRIRAATGRFRDGIGETVREHCNETSIERIAATAEAPSSHCASDHFVGNFTARTGTHNVVLVEGDLPPNAVNSDLMDLFGRHVSIAYENLLLRDEMETTLREIIYRLSEVVETRSLETGNHVRRVAEYSRILGEGMGLDECDVHLLWTASPLHDIGKVGVSDLILKKPGKLTAEEFDTMKRHTLIGETMLSGSKQRVFQAAAIIAGQHHERWNGRGYPRSLSGTDIHIFGRVTAAADVFDALGSKRVYKDAWELDRILSLFREERGEHFDPQVVDVLFDRLDEILAIRERFCDSDAELAAARAAS